mgnify:CR=1 FL=1
MALKLGPRLNVHHTFWPKSEYTTRYERNFREHFGLVSPVAIVNHDLLHSRMTPPPKPERSQMRDLMDYLEDTPAAVQVERLWGLDKSEKFFRAIGQSATEEAFKALRIADHLEEQMGILSMRLVEIKIV